MKIETERFIYNDIENDEYDGILHIVEVVKYGILISDVLDEFRKKCPVKIPKAGHKILLDNFLLVGNYRSRFTDYIGITDSLAICKKVDGRNLSEEIIQKSNDILRKYPDLVKNAIIPVEKDKQTILENMQEELNGSTNEG